MNHGTVSVIGSYCLVLLGCSGAREPAGDDSFDVSKAGRGGHTAMTEASPAGSAGRSEGGHLGQQVTGGAGGVAGRSGTQTGGVTESTGGSLHSTSAGVAGAEQSGGHGGAEQSGGHGGTGAQGGSMAISSDTGGTSGGGGGLGAGQAGQMSGGAGGRGLPQCARAADTIEGCVRSGNQTLVTAPESVVVSVISVGEATRGACSAPNFDASSDANVSSNQTYRIVLRARDGREWTLFVRIPQMPADLVAAGDEYELSIEATVDAGVVSQTIVLARDARIQLFTTTLNPRPLSLPNLLAYGVNVGGEGDRCEDSVVNGCLHKGLAAHVAVGGESAIVDRGQTVEVGSLAFSVEAFELVTRSETPCDRAGFTQMAGFSLPSPVSEKSTKPDASR